MAEASKTLRMGGKAFVLGYTGEVGKVLAKTLIEKNIFDKVILVGRRTVKENEMEPYGRVFAQSNAVQVEVDFDKIDQRKDVFDGCDVGFCCLGTTRGKAGKDGFYKIEHDYVVNTARVAHSAGCKQYHFITSQGTTENSWFYYFKVKAEVEKDIKAIGFERVGIYRPGMMMCDRAERRLREKAVMALMKPIAWLAPTWKTVPTVTVAKAMIESAFKRGPCDVYENADLHAVGNEFEQHFGK